MAVYNMWFRVLELVHTLAQLIDACVVHEQLQKYDRNVMKLLIFNAISEIMNFYEFRTHVRISTHPNFW